MIDFNKNCFCISGNPLQYNHLCLCLNKFGIKNPNLFDYNIYKTHCRRSHEYIIEYSKRHNLDYCIIFEDDAYPCLDFLNKWINVSKSLSNINYGVLVFGRNGSQTNYINEEDLSLMKFWIGGEKYKRKYYKNNNYDILNNDIIRIHRNVFGSHAYCVLNGYYDEVLNAFKLLPAPDLALSSDFCPSVVHIKDSLFIQKNLIKKKLIFSDYNNISSDFIITNKLNDYPIGYGDLYTEEECSNIDRYNYNCNNILNYNN